MDTEIRSRIESKFVDAKNNSDEYVYKTASEDETRARFDANIDTEKDLYKCPYIIQEKKDKYKVIAPMLYEYIKSHGQYIFARSDVKSFIQKYIYQKGVYKLVSDDEFRGIIRSYLPVLLQETKVINEVYKLLLMDDCFISLDELNADENIINFKNGILRLDTMQLLPHSPTYNSTIQLPIDYNANVIKPENSIFEQYINYLTEGDSERRQLILEFMGVALSNIAGYRMKKALFMIGDGNTGKSQCKELLNRILGQGLFSSIDLNALEERFGTSQIYDKRLIGSNDMGFLAVKELSRFKQLTGGDSIQAEYKGENAFTFKFKGVIWF
jgi:phage/plasmid-associated DNA primase